MKAIVTGGGGFLGQHVARALKKSGYKVTILGRRNYPDLEKEGFKTIKCNIENKKDLINAFEGYDEVHHVASLTGITVNKKPFYQTNVLGTQNVIDACKLNSIKKLIYTSSPSVVFDHTKNQYLIDETEPYPEKFLDYYTETKAISEKLILMEKNIATVSLRPYLIFGPQDTNLIPRLIKRAGSRRLKIVGNGDNLVDMTYVENAASAHILASKKLYLGSPICGEAFFITNDEPINPWNFINTLLTDLDLTPIRKKISFPTAYTLGFMMENLYKAFKLKKEPIMTRFLASQLAKNHCYSIKKAKSLLGYSPLISMKDGLKKTIISLKHDNSAH